MKNCNNLNTKLNNKMKTRNKINKLKSDIAILSLKVNLISVAYCIMLFFFLYNAFYPKPKEIIKETIPNINQQLFIETKNIEIKSSETNNLTKPTDNEKSFEIPIIEE